jgi:PAP2 superfamily C-terminal
VACLATSVSGDPIFAVALWSMVVLDYAVEIYEGFHYSVDMWLGMVLVVLLWNVLSPLEGVTPDEVVQPDVGSSTRIQDLYLISTPTLVIYVLPALIAYLQLTILPQETANILIVSYACCAVAIYFLFVWKEVQERRIQLYTHYVQHILLCLLFMALGIYL